MTQVKAKKVQSLNKVDPKNVSCTVTEGLQDQADTLRIQIAQASSIILEKLIALGVYNPPLCDDDSDAPKKICNRGNILHLGDSLSENIDLACELLRLVEILKTL